VVWNATGRVEGTETSSVVRGRLCYIYIYKWSPFLMKSYKTPAPQDNYDFTNLSFHEKSAVTRKFTRGGGGGNI
jgi:hypothetical protein